MSLQLATIPPSGPHTHTMIFCHGRGSTATQFADEILESRDSRGRSLQDIFPSWRWVFPQSEMRRAAAFDEDWCQWFDMENVQDPHKNEEEQLVSLNESVEALLRVIKSEAAKLKGGLRDVVLAGISQGCAVAVHALLNLEAPSNDESEESRDSRETMSNKRLAAFVGLSSWMPFPASSLEEARDTLCIDGNPSDDFVANTPVLLEHCIDDATVPIQNGRELNDTLENYGADVTWKEYRGGGHWLNEPKGVDDLAAFLARQTISS